MFIKFFVEGKEENEALQLIENALKEIENIDKKEIKEIVPYWKEENTYIVEVIIELQQNTLHKFLEHFSDEWLEIGCPVDELLASKTSQGCSYMKKGFAFINIFL